MKFRITNRIGWEASEQESERHKARHAVLRAECAAFGSGELEESKGDRWPIVELPDDTASFLKAFAVRFECKLGTDPPTLEIQDDYD